MEGFHAYDAARLERYHCVGGNRLLTSSSWSSSHAPMTPSGVGVGVPIADTVSLDTPPDKDRDIWSKALGAGDADNNERVVVGHAVGCLTGVADGRAVSVGDRVSVGSRVGVGDGGGAGVGVGVRRRVRVGVGFCAGGGVRVRWASG